MGLTIKQENFCQKYIETGNASEAYRHAYNAKTTKLEAIHVRASELLSNGKVAVRIAELKEINAKRHHITVDSITFELEEARQIARDTMNASGMIQATLGKAKLHGLLKDKVEVSHNFIDRVLQEIDGLTKDIPNKLRTIN
jgi:hypothetical protein